MLRDHLSASSADYNMYYTYVLIILKIYKLYIGYTEDLKKRFKQHNSKRGGDYTSKNGPYKLIFYEAFLNEEDARQQEKFYKTGYGREVLKEKLKNTLKQINN